MIRRVLSIFTARGRAQRLAEAQAAYRQTSAAWAAADARKDTRAMHAAEIANQRAMTNLLRAELGL